jgi:hypothetical protein
LIDLGNLEIPMTSVNFEQLSIFRLKAGAHKKAAQGLCFMEAVAWLEGEPHSDSPECVCLVIAAYSRRLNDRLPGAWRQRLVAYLPRVVGTRSKEHELQRAEHLARRAVTVILPLLADAIRAPDVGAMLRTIRPDASMIELREAARWARPKLPFVVAPAVSAAAAAVDAAAAAAAAVDAAAAAAAAVDAAAAAASAVANAARIPLYEASIATLDGLLAIGPSGRPFAQPVGKRIAAYRELMEA